MPQLAFDFIRYPATQEMDIILLIENHPVHNYSITHGLKPIDEAETLLREFKTALTQGTEALCPLLSSIFGGVVEGVDAYDLYFQTTTSMTIIGTTVEVAEGSLLAMRLGEVDTAIGVGLDELGIFL